MRMATIELLACAELMMKSEDAQDGFFISSSPLPMHIHMVTICQVWLL